VAGGGAKHVRCTVGDVTFAVKAGNITEQSCDAIVNSTNEKLDLSRGLLLYYCMQSAFPYKVLVVF